MHENFQVEDSMQLWDGIVFTQSHKVAWMTASLLVLSAQNVRRAGLLPCIQLSGCLLYTSDAADE